jgi:Ca2+-binding RTX toxin-like protein
VEHAFQGSGNFNVLVTAEDKNGGVSTAFIHTVNIEETQLQGTTLAIGGTAANDIIKVGPNGTTVGSFRVTRGVANSVYNNVNRLEIYTLGGNDKVTLSGKVTVATEMHGGDGNDRLKGGNGPNLLLGEAGNDTLIGGILRDVLIGGLDNDSLKGRAGDDLLIGSITDHDDDQVALQAIMAEWGSGSNYNLRVEHLNGATAGGLNGTTYLSTSTVDDDAANDRYTGSKDLDWFFIHKVGFLSVETPDVTAGEIVTGV